MQDRREVAETRTFLRLLFLEYWYSKNSNGILVFGILIWDTGNSLNGGGGAERSEPCKGYFEVLDALGLSN